MEDIQRAFIDPDQPTIDYAELDFDEQLKHTQRIKSRVLHKLTSGMEGIPTDKDSVELILKVADSMDKTTIAKKRVNTEAKASDGALSILNAIALSVTQGGNKNPFVIDPSATDIVVEPKEIGHMPDYENKHAEGEGDQGVITETSEAFTLRMEKINREDMLLREAALGIELEVPVASQ